MSLQTNAPNLVHYFVEMETVCNVLHKFENLSCYWKVTYYVLIPLLKMLLIILYIVIIMVNIIIA